MVLYGYDASVFNSVQVNKQWLSWFDIPKGELLALVNTTYAIGAIVAGWFLGGPTVSAVLMCVAPLCDLTLTLKQADFFGRRAGMAIGCLITVVATVIQTFSPYHKIGVFIFGRVLIGLGQGIALSEESKDFLMKLCN